MSTKWMPLAVALLATGCVALPNGPAVMVLPGSTKTFDQFRADDAGCRHYAYLQVGGQTANDAATDSAVRSAVVGTILGAAAGAAIGGDRGAAAGAATGLVMGSAAGANSAQYSAYGTQRRYDHAYVQCMYAQGHRVPASGRLSANAIPGYLATPPIPSYRDAPPPGSPPPPPPGYPPAPPPDAGGARS